MTATHGFPVELLRADDDVLCLFAAHFGGCQDIAQVYGRVATVAAVDNDSEKLVALEEKFPGVELLDDDAYEFVIDTPRDAYSVVTCDNWSGWADVKVRAMLVPLLSITTRLLLLSNGHAEKDETIRTLRVLGHEPRVIERSDTCWWLVVEKGVTDIPEVAK